MKNKYIQINKKDNVYIALVPLKKGMQIKEKSLLVTLREDIPIGHKFSLARIEKGEEVIKYGFPIGVAIQKIEAGSYVHTHNLHTGLGKNLTYQYNTLHESCNSSTIISQLKVNGFLRYDGNMGIRNELWIIPTVGCVNGLAQLIIERVKNQEDISHIDDIKVYKHNYGCSQLGDDHENTRKAIAGIVKHPNAGGVLVLGLGCENNQIDELKKELKQWDKERVQFMIAQQVDDEIEEGVKLVRGLIQRMRHDQRENLPLSKLKVGLKCGASDGFSGITANVLVGLFSDWLISEGGVSILTEVPEMFGAETILMNRAKNHTVFKNIVRLINDFKDYFRQYNQPIYENPSPGNKAGGITTLEEKSLGCIQKGGHAIVSGVLDYAESVEGNGLYLLKAPGNDLVSSSALALSGCQLILFTTGLGTPFGTFVPTIKISTNSALYKKKKHWIDFDAGALLEGVSKEDLLEKLISYIISVAEGKLVNHELIGFKEFVIFKSGVTL